MKKTVLICFCLLTAIAANAQDELCDSLVKASRQLSFHPDSVDLRLKKAGWNIELQQWQYALDEYNTILKHDPSNLTALYFRAYVNQKLGRYKFARIDYNNVLKIVPGNFDAQLGLVLLNEKDKHFTDAIDGINRLVNQFPDSAITYAIRAGIELNRGLLELAEYDYTEALKRDADNTDYLLSRANVRIRLKKDKDALKDLRHLQRLGIPKVSLKDMYDKLK